MLANSLNVVLAIMNRNLTYSLKLKENCDKYTTHRYAQKMKLLMRLN